MFHSESFRRAGGIFTTPGREQRGATQGYVGSGNKVHLPGLHKKEGKGILSQVKDGTYLPKILRLSLGEYTQN